MPKEDAAYNELHYNPNTSYQFGQKAKFKVGDTVTIAVNSSKWNDKTGVIVSLYVPRGRFQRGFVEISYIVELGPVNNRVYRVFRAGELIIAGSNNLSSVER